MRKIAEQRNTKERLQRRGVVMVVGGRGGREKKGAR